MTNRLGWMMFAAVWMLFGIGACSDDNASGPCAGLSDGATCDDGNPCTQGDVCWGGACAGNPAADGASCAERQGCMESFCQAGECVPQKATDDTACGETGTCLAWLCRSGECVKTNGCDDGNDCTVDRCDAETGECTHETDESYTCDDKNPCTDDVADCTVEGNCLFTPLADGTACEAPPEHPCQKGTCQAGICFVTESLPDGTDCTSVLPTDGLDAACYSAQSQCLSGQCPLLFPTEGEPCGTQGDCHAAPLCSQGVCQAGVPKPAGTNCSEDCRSGACDGEGRCQGESRCTQDQTCCDNLCVDTDNNAYHCGSCGHVCHWGESCCGGSCCEMGCMAGKENTCAERYKTACDGVVTTLLDNQHHCGSCGNDCGADATCCGLRCIDTTNNFDHCGGCYNRCQADNDERVSCQNRRCVTEPSGATCVTQTNNACSAYECCHTGGSFSCRDTATDDLYCGGCSGASICRTDEFCLSGSCRSRFNSDENHCGGRNNTCSSDQICCEGACVQKGTSTHCSGCNACRMNQSCQGGICRDL